MARRSSGMDVVASLPWPMGIGLGIAGYFGIRYGVQAWFAHAGGPMGQAMARQGDLLAPVAWFWLALCCIAAAASWTRSRRRRQLLDTRTDLESLSSNGWRDFERLVGEAFRRQGYAIEETGLGGADGGIDLILRKDGRRTLVQCKQWRRDRVGATIVREMYGLLAHHKADAVKIVSTGRFTRDAEAFVRGKPIDLIPGATLLHMIHAVQTKTSASVSAPPSPFRTAPATSVPQSANERSAATPATKPANTQACPRCGADMVQRRNSRTGESFMGCSRYPACKQTAPILP